jgi:hypothetical protein
MGLCGIGPVGFFDLSTIFEIISIENLTITSNTITNVLLRDTDSFNAFGTASAAQNTGLSGTAPLAGANPTTGTFSSVGTVNAGTSTPYGAISVAFVENLVHRDNAITNFGANPGIKANGIFVLIGEIVEISRNQILETRDWTQATKPPPTPAVFTAASSSPSQLLPRTPSSSSTARKPTRRRMASPTPTTPDTSSSISPEPRPRRLFFSQ